MPKFYVEFSFCGGGDQKLIEAKDSTSAVFEFLRQYPYGLVPSQHDDESDPRRVYHGRGRQAWEHISVSVSPPRWDCANPKCTESYGDPDLVESAGEYCGSCTFECNDCGKELDLSELKEDENSEYEYICKTCASPLVQLAKAFEED